MGNAKSLSQDEQIGLGVGLGVGLPVLAAIIAAVYFLAIKTDPHPPAAASSSKGPQQSNQPAPPPVAAAKKFVPVYPDVAQRALPAYQPEWRREPELPINPIVTAQTDSAASRHYLSNPSAQEFPSELRFLKVS